MSLLGKGTRDRAPPGYYCSLSGRKSQRGKLEIKMADEEEKQTGELLSSRKSKKSRSKASSKKASSVVESEMESRLKDLDREETQVDNKLAELEDRDAYSTVLHERAMNRQIDFIEDLNPPEKLENDDVWEKVNADHEREDALLLDRKKQLQRREELMEVKNRLRENRLQLVQHEKRLEREDLQRQMEA